MNYNLGYQLPLVIILISCFIVSQQTCPQQQNQRPLLDIQPRFIEKVQHGQKYIIGDLNDPQGNYLYLAKLKGTSYEMGKAFGMLYKQEIKDQLKNFLNYYSVYLEEQIQKNPRIPAFLKPIFEKKTPEYLNTVLDLNVAVTKRYTNQRYFDELRGMAQGAGIDKRQGQRFNIFPEFVKAACTVAGLWGKATKNGQTLHMRALDWDSANPMNKYPLVTIYHPTEQGIQKHANFAWVGLIGVLTGMSERLTIGEKVWLPPQNSVKMTRFGTPWTYVLRNVISEATNMSQAISMLTKAHRTCAIHLGIGSLQDHSFRMFEYSYKILNNYNDSNYTYTAAHPKAEGVAYFDKHAQPSHDDCVGSILIKSSYYGKWDAQTFWRILGLSHPTGDTQLVVFDLQAQNVYISYSRNYMQEDKQKTEKAFVRNPIKINMNSLWADF